MKMNWKNITKYPPPEGKSILAAWFLDGYIEGVEWYVISEGDWWNQNSNNLNEFNKTNPSPTHWVLFDIEK